MDSGHRVRVFSNADTQAKPAQNPSALLEGTCADVYVLSKPLDDRQMQCVAAESSANATVFHLINNISTDKTCNTRIFNQTHEIQVCGHGLLALLNILKIKRLLTIGYHLELPSMQVDFNISEQIWLGFAPVPISNGVDNRVELDCKYPWLKNAFSEIPNKVTVVGDSNGYLIAEWPVAKDLKGLEVNLERLQKNTSRALIATQGANAHSDFNLRYFAPQHGVDEDPATGSAVRVLTSYWHPKLKKSSYKALQLSNQGGLIYSKAAENKIWISGNLEIMSELGVLFEF
ncbi:PhzF family phenazine biosynthesis protein [Kangiella sp. HZ709]|uniref:PhzF family phenazine biosynthesis protein n=1 Tax=Kangiella sp. HZ709 TaxID=2666328 RepID=UPI0012B04780|nr:PhzF family phenazine biosynthesis protein [Kangiella sp. HZ709]MRX26612.1 hypothetical protein [Kangiella sp. HZ709]